MNKKPSKQELVPIDIKNNELILIDADKIKQYDYHAKQDAKRNIYRVGNELMRQMKDMNPKSWRLMELAIKKLDLYSSKIPEHKDFVAGLEHGDKYIPPEFRTITITAKEFTEAYKLQPKTGINQFTNSAIELMDEKLYSIDETDEEASLKLEHVIGSMTFKVRKNKGSSYTPYQKNEMIKKLPNGRTELLHLSGEIKFELSMYTAKGLFLIMNQFTRISSSVTRKLSMSAHKLYTLMCMERAYELGKENWILEWDLNTWNARLGTNHKSMATLIRTFNAHNEITEVTNLIATCYPDEKTKVGKSYKIFIVEFRENREFRLTGENKDGTERPNLPRPSKAAQRKGSHEQGEWARECIKILMRYQKECESNGKRFPKRDKDRLDKYLTITGGLFDSFE